MPEKIRHAMIIIKYMPGVSVVIKTRGNWLSIRINSTMPINSVMRGIM